jgi:murein DD-endopeptidase MepM/ murein hydrolase activator NlpD
MRRFVLSLRELRYLMTLALTLLCTGGWLWSDYLAVQKKEVEEVVAKARAQQQKLSALHEKTREVQESLASWRGLREKVYAAVPRRHRASSKAPQEGEELEEMLAVLHGELKQMVASLPSDWPVQGKVVSGVGMRPSPWSGEMEFHSGLDIPKPIGTAVHAPGDAVVESIAQGGGTGGTIVLDHGQEIKTQYAHLSKILVNRGDRVQKGQPIGQVGSTGKSTGPHLHYEVRVNGIPIDPRGGLLSVTAGEAIQGR